MNIKLQLGEVRLLIDKRFPIEQISNQLQSIAPKANLIFAEHQVGAGYLQWALPGSDWTAFPNGSDSQKDIVAQVYKERKAQMQSFLQGSFLKDIVFSVPSEDFIFFRQNGDGWDIALTAWGYKYPNKPASGELDTWISKHDLQEVNIAFVWAGQTLPELSFKLSGYTRTTSLDGFMHVDGPLPVGKSYPIETLTGQSFTLLVEKGRSDYIFDLTQYCQAEIIVCQDNTALSDYACEVDFGGSHTTLTTDASGRTLVQLPLKNDSLGQIAIPQPPCIVTCGAENQQQVPSRNGDVLSFVFNFKKEVPEPPIVDWFEAPDKHVHVKVEVFRGDEPVADQSAELLFDGNSHILKTNEKGEAFFDIVLKDVALQGTEETRPVCEVICADEHQSKHVEADTTGLVFRFDLPAKIVPPKEPEYVYVQLKDYAGEPLIDMPFNLTTKNKGCISLKTNHEGRCKLPKEWFTHKEKMKIDFTVSKEYQETHDIHRSKKQKK